MSTAIPKRFLGAFKAGHRASAREFIDEELSYQLLKRIQDSNYTDQEALDQLDYITKFNNEFHKNVIKKGDPNALHNTDELRKDCYARENARNRDITSLECGRMKSIESRSRRPINEGYTEDSAESLDLESYLNERRSLNNHEDVLAELLDHEESE